MGEKKKKEKVPRELVKHSTRCVSVITLPEYQIMKAQIKQTNIDPKALIRKL